MRKKINPDRAVWIEIEELAEIGPIVHESHGEENWYFRALTPYRSTYPAGQKFFVKIG